MMNTILLGLVVFQILDTIYNFKYGLVKWTIYHSFFVWHLSAIFFFIDGSIFLVLLQLLNCALSFKSLSKLRVVEVVGVGNELDVADLKNVDEDDPIKFLLSRVESGDLPEDARVFEMTFMEKRFFGFVKEVKTIKVPVSLNGSSKQDFENAMIGVKFEVVI